MTNPGRHRTASATTGLLLLASVLNAGTVIDLASENISAVHGTFEEEQFGYCLAAGDFDADGDIDIVVGAPGLTDSVAGAHVGGVYVFRLSALDTLSADVPATTLAQWTIAGSEYRGRFGSAVAVADLDGDGFDDLAVGAPGAGLDGAIARGEVSVYFGGPGNSLSLGPGAAPEIVLEGTCPGARLGWSMLASDLDDDGAAELLLSEPQGGGTAGARPGAIHVVSGAALRSVSGAAVVADVAVSSIVGESAGDALSGMAVTDTDGDGGLDLVLGAYHADGPGTKLPDVGKLYIVTVREVLEQRSLSLPTVGARTVLGLTERGFLGRSLAAGDIDSDGIGDLLVSAYASKAQGKKLKATGEAFLLFGDPENTGETGADVRTLDDPTVSRFRGGSTSDLFGFTVLLVDLNGDRSDDIVMASQHADGPDGERNACGEIYIYWGSLRSVVAAKVGSSELADVTIVGQSARDSIGAALLAVEISEDRRPGLLIGASDAPGTEDDGAITPRRGKLVLVPGELLF
ncbi:FG-GAP repeat protein [bacterium]|nr:FG-GAP repeat protein [bacterium]